MFKFWRIKVQLDVKTVCKKYYSNSVKKLKDVNTSRWWKEVKPLVGLTTKDTWYHQLFWDDIPTSDYLAETY